MTDTRSVPLYVSVEWVIHLWWESTGFKVKKKCYDQTETVLQSSFLFSACTFHNSCGLIVGAKQMERERKWQMEARERKDSSNFATNGLLTQTCKNLHSSTCSKSVTSHLCLSLHPDGSSNSGFCKQANSNQATQLLRTCHNNIKQFTKIQHCRRAEVVIQQVHWFHLASCSNNICFYYNISDNNRYESVSKCDETHIKLNHFMLRKNRFTAEFWSNLAYSLTPILLWDLVKCIIT